MKNALRSLHRPQQLLRNPLLASSMIQNALREHPDQRPNEILRSLIFESAQVLKSDPRAETRGVDAVITEMPSCTQRYLLYMPSTPGTAGTTHRCVGYD